MSEVCPQMKCCGCSACAQICPVGCISMVEDPEGFLFPEIDQGKCIDCGKCKKVCPVLNATPAAKPAFGYAYRTNDDALLRRTSSGGFFSLLAENVLRDGGVVFGASFDEHNEVFHTFIESVEDLDLLRRSKYVQSRIGNSFVECLKFLNAGRKVLFCGTPCQIKALNLFIGKKWDNLITVDFVCHGVPSPGVFRRYLVEICGKYHESVSDIEEINFREKIAGFAYGFSLMIKDKKYTENPRENMFLKGFLSDLYLRKSCHHCSAKNFTSGADYTMCDFWGIEKILPTFPKHNIPGVSQVFVTDDRLSVFANPASTIRVATFDVNNRKLTQRWVFDSVPCTKRRSSFFDQYFSSIPIGESVSEICKRTPGEMAVALVRRLLGRAKRIVGLK